MFNGMNVAIMFADGVNMMDLPDYVRTLSNPGGKSGPDYTETPVDILRQPGREGHNTRGGPTLRLVISNRFLVGITASKVTDDAWLHPLAERIVASLLVA